MSQQHCENCSVILQGDFCHVCGQTKQSSSRFFGTIFMYLLDNLFSYDSRVYKTLIPLMPKPGFVCSEYLSGKRVSFLPPFRLYLFASIVYFLFYEKSLWPVSSPYLAKVFRHFYCLHNLVSACSNWNNSLGCD